MNFMSINKVILKELLKYAYKVLFLHILKKNNNNERFLEISECYLKILYCLAFVSFLFVKKIINSSCQF